MSDHRAYRVVSLIDRLRCGQNGPNRPNTAGGFHIRREMAARKFHGGKAQTSENLPGACPPGNLQAPRTACAGAQEIRNVWESAALFLRFAIYK